MPLDKKPQEDLEKMLAHFEELESQLRDPKVIAARSKYQEITTEYAGLAQTVRAYRRYKKMQDEIKDLDEMTELENSELRQMAVKELKGLRQKEEAIEEELCGLLKKNEEGLDRDVIMEIRAGTGGKEAALFSSVLYRMYTRYAQKKRWRTDILSLRPSESGGFKEIIFSVEGEGAYRYLGYESGVHRVQRVPVTETAGRIHTSAVTVAVLPQAEETEVTIDPKELHVDVFRSSGHGGQSVNTTDSAVRITHLPTNTVVTCQDERSQFKNKLKAMKVLRARLLDRKKDLEKKERAKERRLQVRSGDRSEKIRTYNFPERRVTDHRIGLTLYKLDSVLEGDLDEIIAKLTEYERQRNE